MGRSRGVVGRSGKDVLNPAGVTAPVAVMLFATCSRVVALWAVVPIEQDAIGADPHRIPAAVADQFWSSHAATFAIVASRSAVYSGTGHPP